MIAQFVSNLGWNLFFLVVGLLIGFVAGLIHQFKFLGCLPAKIAATAAALYALFRRKK